jgi:hypothetical protein
MNTQYVATQALELGRLGLAILQLTMESRKPHANLSRKNSVLIAVACPRYNDDLQLGEILAAKGRGLL